MNRLAAILVLLTALSIGWVPVFAAPGRLAEEMGSHSISLADTSSGPVHVHRSNGCTGGQHHCPQKQQHPAICAACIGVPAVTLPALVIGQPKIIVPRGEELPLVARADAPLPRPPRH
ncbi:hypothetical protein [Phyllobacterium zundukense]|uniref:DUF2946 domain-containing protein n=1 Tax=Phyllobacterium zundukense TaxID=1867719 RepID=A0A2N9W3V0_9HYPH|nr:hypothetical protein [Phyllobacterium zundukense]ATU92108.1 hypothetical protein BLM14_11040 [Phyllobacterium zundukense]PIO46418.1 hypothetical protein B5P45_01030 [Phyllobacterium zundukense]